MRLQSKKMVVSCNVKFEEMENPTLISFGHVTDGDGRSDEDTQSSSRNFTSSRIMFLKLLRLSTLRKLTTTTSITISKIEKKIAEIPLRYDDQLDSVKLPHSREVLSPLFQKLRVNRSYTREQSAV